MADETRVAIGQPTFKLTVKYPKGKTNVCEDFTLDITHDKHLLWYMEKASVDFPTRLTGISIRFYLSLQAYMITGINGVEANWDEDHTYWYMSNNGKPLPVGVSDYRPFRNNEICVELKKSNSTFLSKL